MFGLLMIFGQIRAEPWYGKNSPFLQGLTTGPYHVEVAGSHLLSVPRPIAAQRERHAAFDLVDTPQGARSRHDQTKRVGAYDAWSLATLIVPQTVEGVGITHVDFHRPALAVLVQDGLGAQGEIGREQGLDRREWLSVPSVCEAACGLTPHHHDPDEPPRPYRVPEPTPGLQLGALFAGVRRPARGGLRHGLGRADQVAFFARGATALDRRRGWHLVALGADREAPHPRGRRREGTDRVFGGIAAVGEGTEGAPGQLLGNTIEPGTGQLTSGTLRDLECVSVRGFQREFEAHRDAEAVTGPTRERHTQDAQDKVHAPQRAVCLAG